MQTYNQSHSPYKRNSYKQTQRNLLLLDQFLNPSVVSEQTLNQTQYSDHKPIRNRSNVTKSQYVPQPPLPHVFSNVSDEENQIRQAQILIERQNKQLKKLLKEQKEVQREMLFNREIESLKYQMEYVKNKLPALAHNAQFHEIKQEIRELRNQLEQSAQYQQEQYSKPQYHNIQYIPYPGYYPYQQQQQRSESQQQRIQKTEPNEQDDKKQQLQNKTLPKIEKSDSIQSKADGDKMNQSMKQSDHYSVQSKLSKKSQESQKSQQSQQSRKQQKQEPIKPYEIKIMPDPDEDKYKQERRLKLRRKLRISFLTVLGAMRWKIYCSPQNKKWRQLESSLVDCKQQIEEITQPVLLSRIQNWIKILLTKIQNYFATVKELDFINEQLNSTQIDQSFTQLTTSIKYLMSSLVSYSVSDFMIPEFKLLCYVQLFEDEDIDRGYFVAKRVFFWNEDQLDMTKTQQMMIVTELLLLVHVLPSLLKLKSAPFLAKCVASLLQIHFMKFFELRVLTKHPQCHLVYINVTFDGQKYQISLKDYEKEMEEERYIVGLFEEKQFTEFYRKRPNFEQELMKGISQVSENLLKSLLGV